MSTPRCNLSHAVEKTVVGHVRCGPNPAQASVAICRRGDGDAFVSLRCVDLDGREVRLRLGRSTAPHLVRLLAQAIEQIEAGE